MNHNPKNILNKNGIQFLGNRKELAKALERN